MWATATVKQTSDQSIASAERQVTIIPLTIGLLSDGLSILGSPEIVFPGLRKRSRLKTLVNIPSHNANSDKLTSRKMDPQVKVLVPLWVQCVLARFC